MLPIERPMASLISFVSNEPEAPTRVPATIRAKLLSVKPVAATASPVHALRSEMTTGMSAPPMGSTKATPRIKASTISETNANGTDAIASSATAKPTTPSASNPLTDRKSTRLNSSHPSISYAVFCLKKKKKKNRKKENNNKKTITTNTEIHQSQIIQNNS